MSLHLKIEPSAVQMLHIIADIVQKENLDKVALVYDGTFGKFQCNIHKSIKFAKYMYNFMRYDIHMQYWAFWNRFYAWTNDYNVQMDIINEVYYYVYVYDYDILKISICLILFD